MSQAYITGAFPSFIRHDCSQHPQSGHRTIAHAYFDSPKRWTGREGVRTSVWFATVRYCQTTCYLIQPRNLSDIRKRIKYVVQSLHDRCALGLSQFKHSLTLDGIKLVPYEALLTLQKRLQISPHKNMNVFMDKKYFSDIYSWNIRFTANISIQSTNRRFRANIMMFSSSLNMRPSLHASHKAAGKIERIFLRT